MRAVRIATGLDANHVVMAEPESANEPRPSKPYVTLKLTSPSTRSGSDVKLRSPELGEGAVVVAGPRSMLCSINTYGNTHEEAYGLAALLEASFGAWPVLDSLAPSHLAVWRIGGVTDLSALLQTGFEGRAHLDVTFGVSSNLAITAATIEQVTVDGVVTPAEGADALIESFTVGGLS